MLRIFLVMELFFSIKSQADNCKALEAAISLTPTLSSQTITAGDTFKFDYQLSLSDPQLLAKFDAAVLSFVFSNQVVGSAPITGDFDLKSIRIADGQTRKISVDFKAGLGMNGVYNGSAVFFGDGSSYCWFKLPSIKGTFVEVLNTTDKTDIDPPVVLSVTPSEHEFLQGSAISFDVGVFDKSPICWNSTGQCTLINHIQVLSADTNVASDFSQEVELLETGTPDHYTFSINKKGAATLSTGTYKVVILNVFDIVGNLSAQLKADLQPTFVIK